MLPKWSIPFFSFTWSTHPANHYFSMNWLSIPCYCCYCGADRSEEGLHLHLPNIAQPSPNLAVFQVTFPLPTSLDLVYLSDAHNNKEDRIKQLSGKPHTPCWWLITILICPKAIRVTRHIHLHLLVMGSDTGGQSQDCAANMLMPTKNVLYQHLH